MCDTIVVCEDMTMDGSKIFAKNSDREGDEAQDLLYFPYKRREQPNAMQKCTYIQVPEPDESFSMLLSKPYWHWGGEMGLNSHGVVIGNEAVFTKESYIKAPTALTGMDLIRLALQQSKTALEALNHITEYIARYGQGGNGAVHKQLYYHNSFLIADPRSAEVWLLETAGKHWAAKSFSKGFYAISNALTIGEDFTRCSPGLQDYALQRGYIAKGQTLNFAQAFSNKFMSYFARAQTRRCRALGLLLNRAGPLAVAALMSLLRDHDEGRSLIQQTGAEAKEEKTSKKEVPPGKTSLRSLCMHASYGPINAVQSTAAMVVALRPELPVCWATSTSGTCTSVFKPFYALCPENVRLPSTESSRYSPTSLWWRHEPLHRVAVLKHTSFQRVAVPKLAALQDEFIREEKQRFDSLGAAAHNNTKTLFELTAQCIQRTQELEDRLLEELSNCPKDSRNVSMLTRLHWELLDYRTRVPQH